MTLFIIFNMIFIYKVGEYTVNNLGTNYIKQLF